MKSKISKKPYRKSRKGYRKGIVSLKKIVKREINKNNNKMLETKTSC